MNKIMPFLFLFIPLQTISQSPSELLNYFRSEIGDINSKKGLYRQDLEPKLPGAPCLVKLRVTEGNDELLWRWNMADLNPQSIQFNTHKNQVFVELNTSGQKDLIQFLENGEVKSYENEVRLRARSIETSRIWIEKLNQYTIGCQDLVKERYKFHGEIPLEQIFSLFKQNFKGFIHNGERIDQIVLESKLPIISFREKRANKDELYKMNLKDIAPASIKFNTKKASILINASTIGKRKLIEIYKNGEKENYTSNFDIYSKDIEQARLLSSLIKSLVNSSNFLPEIDINGRHDGSFSGKLELLGDLIGEVSVNDKLYKQSFEFFPDMPELVKISFHLEGKGDRFKYQFNLSDINESSIKFDTRSEEVIIFLETLEKNDFIKVLKNGKIDDYVDSIIIVAKEVEHARLLEELLKKAVAQSKGRNQNYFRRKYQEPDYASALLFCKEEISKVSNGDDVFQQSFESLNSKECLTQIKVTEQATGKHYAYHFNWADIDPYKTRIEIKGKQLRIKAETRHGQDLVEVWKDGEIEEFENEFFFLCNELEQARAILDASKIIMSYCEH